MSDYQLIINGIDMTPPSEWDAQWEERIDGVGTASVTIQDRSNDPTINYGRARDTFQIRIKGVDAFAGEVTGSTVDLPPGRPWRRWKISASDYNTILDLRLVGVPDGSQWRTIDGGQTYEPYDPDARGQSRDGDTVAALFAAYARIPTLVPIPGPVSLDTTTFVHNFIPYSVMVDPATGESRLSWTHTTLRAALDEMRSLGGFPIFCWVGPGPAIGDRPCVHWTTLPDPMRLPGRRLTMMAPSAPYIIEAPAAVTDTEPNGRTSVGGRGLSIKLDATYMPEQAYVVGVTDFIHNGGTTRYQGTGFGRRAARDRVKRQILVDAQAVNESQKDAVAAHYQKFSQRARIRGQVTVGRPDESVDGWRCGEMLTVIDARLPAGLSGTAFPIQRVAGSLKAGNDFRVYTLEWGDAPTERFSQKYRQGPQRLPTARLPAKEHEVKLPATLRPSTSYTVYSQMRDRSGKPFRHAGVPVTWSLTVKDRIGVTVGAGSIAAITSVTDAHGRTAATLTTGAATDLHYHARCTTAAQ